jgi:serine/threonine protein kinase
VYERGADGLPIVKKLREVCGSKSYAAPEVLDGRGYEGFPADVWSCGICLFAMLAGFFPLDEASGSDWRFERLKLAAAAGHSVTVAIFGFYERECSLSREVCQLIDRMLIVEPTRRLTITQSLSSPWVTGVTVPVSMGAGTATASPAMTDEPMMDEGGAIYRGMAPGSSAADFDTIKAMIVEWSDEFQSTSVYRGGPALGPPPTLQKQAAKAPHIDAAEPA